MSNQRTTFFYFVEGARAFLQGTHIAMYNPKPRHWSHSVKAAGDKAMREHLFGMIHPGHGVIKGFHQSLKPDGKLDDDAVERHLRAMIEGPLPRKYGYPNPDSLTSRIRRENQLRLAHQKVVALQIVVNAKMASLNDENNPRAPTGDDYNELHDIVIEGLAALLHELRGSDDNYDTVA